VGKGYRGGGVDVGNSVVLDATGYIYIYGYFSQTVDFDPHPVNTYNLSSKGQQDIFILKLNPDGEFQWVKQIGGIMGDYPHSITIDSRNNIYASGNFRQTVDFDPGPGTYNLSSKGTTSDAFILKLDPEGNFLWVLQIEGENTSSSDVNSLVTDEQGNILGTGRYFKTITMDPGVGNNFSPVPPATVNSNTLIFKYQDCGLQKIPICLITVDSSSTKNVIVWEKPDAQGIDSVLIYRDIIGNYTKIGAVAFSELSEFTDTTHGIDPRTTAYRYKIFALDSCGNESAQSALHKTMHLQINSGLNLSWNDYEGFSYTYYRILRDTAGTGNWQEVDSVASGITSWTDVNPPADMAQNRYMVEVVPPEPCTATRNQSYASSRSNARPVIPASIVEATAAQGIKVYPNPSGGLFFVELSAPLPARIRVYNMLGEKVLEQELTSERAQLNLSPYGSGMYYLQWVTEKGSGTQKLMVE
jgi:hypothetical protein